MKLSTTLLVKKIARKGMLWAYWPPWAKQSLKGLSYSARIAKMQLAGGVKLSTSQGCLTVSKGSRTVTVPLSQLSTSEKKYLLLKNFDSLFDIPELAPNGSSLDFSKAIRIGGLSVRTDFGMALEIPSIKGYMRHYSPKKGDTVFDCGGYHGLFSLFASPLVGNTGKIYCFEPDLENAKILEENLRQNSIKNVTLVPKGVWDKDGSVQFVSGKGESSYVDFSSQGQGGNSQIEVVSLQSFCRSSGAIAPDLVKMDIEGAELEAVQGCIELMRGHAMNFAIASYHLRHGQETYHSLEKMFKSAGYAVATEFTDTITTYAWIAKGAKP